MNRLATLLTEVFGLEVVVVKGNLAFAQPQGRELTAALSNIVEAFKLYKHLIAVTADGKRYLLMQRPNETEAWVKNSAYDVCNDAVVAGATLSKTVSNGDLLVYDALNGRDILYLPAGGLS